MVLDDNATASQSFEDNVPFSDSDPYASGSWGSQQGPFARYPFSAFPTQINLPPLNFFGRMILSEKGYGERVAVPLAMRMNSMSAVMKRYPTQDETDAITSQVAKRAYINRAGLMLGFMVGVSRVRIPKEVRPPKDIPWSSYSKFLLENIRLQSNTVAWSMSRSFFFVGLWTLGFDYASDFYSSMVLAYETMTDPRLEDYRKTVTSMDPVEVRKTITETNRKTAENWHKEAIRRRRQSQGMVTSGQDDASPTGSMTNGDDYSGGYSESNDTKTYGSESGSHSGTQGSTASNVGTLDSQTRQRGLQERQASNLPSDTSNNESNNAGMDFLDDASPTAQDSTNSGNSSSGGSAWARIRQGATQSNPRGSFRRTPEQQQQQQYDSSPSSSTGGSAYGSRTDSDFQYSDAERDRQMAKEQAQKEFDRMVDSERSGSDGSGESSTGGQTFGRGGAWARR